MGKSDSNADPKINIQLEGPFGGKQVEEVKVDSNRQSNAQQFQRGWFDQLGMPAKPADILLQACCWIAVGAFAVSFSAILPDSIGLVLVYGIVVIAFAVVSIMAAFRFPSLAPSLNYRLFLLMVGGLIGYVG